MAMERMLYDRIEAVIADIQHEASTIILQQAIKGRGTEAYFLSQFVIQEFSYDDHPIRRDYTVPAPGYSNLHTSRDPDVALLDRSAGLLFRWFKGITTEPMNGFVRTKNVTGSITEAEALRLYRTLETISDRCLKGLSVAEIEAVRDCCEICDRNCTDLENLYARIDPLLLRYLRIWPTVTQTARESVEVLSLSRLINAGKTVGIFDFVNLRHESLLHLAVKHADRDLFARIEIGLECGLTSTAFSLYDCFGETPIHQALRKYNSNIGTQSLKGLISLSRVFPVWKSLIYVPKTEMLQRIPHLQLSRSFESTSVPMTPLMYAVYMSPSRGYGAVDTILTAQNKDAWVSETSPIPVSSIIPPQRSKNRFNSTSSLGPIHVAIWIKDGSMIEKVLSNKGTFISQFTDAVAFAIKTRDHDLILVLHRVYTKVKPSEEAATEILVYLRERGRRLLEPILLQMVRNKLLPDTTTVTNEDLLRNLLLLLAKEVRFDRERSERGDYAEEYEQYGEEYDEELSGPNGAKIYGVYNERGSEEHSRKVSWAPSQGDSESGGMEHLEHQENDTEHDQHEKPSERLNERPEQQLYQGDHEKHNASHDEDESGEDSDDNESDMDRDDDSAKTVHEENDNAIDIDIPDASDAFPNEKSEPPKVINIPPPRSNQPKSWVHRPPFWKGSGSGLDLASSILSIISTTSNSTISSGAGSVISLGGMPFKTNWKPSPPEMPTQDEEAEIMEIDFIPT
ncbi:hypothetical protein TWF281_001573 [Arthrobotrys megalospora]